MFVLSFQFESELLKCDLIIPKSIFMLNDSPFDLNHFYSLSVTVNVASSKNGFEEFFDLGVLSVSKRDKDKNIWIILSELYIKLKNQKKHSKKKKICMQ